MNPVSSRSKEATSEFARPANTTAYAANDAIAATTDDTDTDALEQLDLGFGAGRAFWLTYARLDTDKDDFTPTVRLHLYKNAAPATARPGDNAAFTRAYANRADYIGYFDFPALADAGDLASAVRDDLRFMVEPDLDDQKVYYRLEIISGTPTPASAQGFFLTVRATDN